MAGTVLYRLCCGHRVWSRWLDHEHEAWKAAVEKGLASSDGGRVYPGPLVWIEKGHRRYAKSHTVPVTEQPDGSPLPAKHRNPLVAHPADEENHGWPLP